MDTKKKFNQLQLQRAELLTRSDKISLDIEAEKKHLASMAVAGQHLETANLKDLEVQAEALKTAILGIDEEIASVSIKLKQEKQAATDEFITDLENKASELIMGAAADCSAMFKKIIELNKLKTENWRFVRLHPEFSSRVLTGEMDLAFIKAALEVLRRMSLLDRNIQPIYDECFQLYRRVQ